MVNEINRRNNLERITEFIKEFKIAHPSIEASEEIFDDLELIKEEKKIYNEKNSKENKAGVNNRAVRLEEIVKKKEVDNLQELKQFNKDVVDKLNDLGGISDDDPYKKLLHDLDDYLVDCSLNADCCRSSDKYNSTDKDRYDYIIGVYIL